MNYYEEFVGQPYQGQAPRDLDALTSRWLMPWALTVAWKNLRVHEQERISDAELYQYLKERGASDVHIRTAWHAASYISLSTGPHMGEFNGHISPPELI